MTTKTQMHWLSHAWEYELPNDQLLTIEAELGYDYTPGEPMVMYERDGSGYPGSPATADLVAVNVREISGDDWAIKRPKYPELIAWFESHLLAETQQDTSYWETLFFDRYQWPEPDND